MSEIVRRPTRVGSVLALLAATVAVAAAGIGAASGAAMGGVGLVALGLGLLVGSRRSVSVGAAMLLLGVLLAGWAGSAPEPLLVGALGGVIAWDVGSNAVSVGNQLGRDTRTARLELVHAASSMVVGAVTVAIGYAVYVTASGGQPVAAVVFLLLGVVVLVSGFR